MTKGRLVGLILVVGIGLASTLWLVLHTSNGDSSRGDSLTGGAGVQTTVPSLDISRASHSGSRCPGK